MTEEKLRLKKPKEFFVSNQCFGSEYKDTEICVGKVLRDSELILWDYATHKAYIYVLLTTGGVASILVPLPFYSYYLARKL